jgi:hypothetical protein
MILYKKGGVLKFQSGGETPGIPGIPVEDFIKRVNKNKQLTPEDKKNLIEAINSGDTPEGHRELENTFLAFDRFGDPAKYNSNDKAFIKATADFDTYMMNRFNPIKTGNNPTAKTLKEQRESYNRDRAMEQEKYAAGFKSVSDSVPYQQLDSLNLNTPVMRKLLKKYNSLDSLSKEMQK